MIYLDYNATTPLDPRVLDAMLPFLREHWGNAASRHAWGRRSAQAVEKAREQVAAALGADPREIIFTSGATEANNLAIAGIARWPSTRRRGRHLITATTEHPAVLDACAALEAEGWTVTRLGVDGDGTLDPRALREALRADTVLVSLMHANNETGVLHPVAELGAICREHGVLFHSDATQSVGREHLDLARLPIDALSLSAHKVYGPKGVGALFLRRRRPRVRCAPLVHGGGQEKGLRSGTLNVPGIVGLGVAAEIAAAERATESARLRSLRDALEVRLLAELPGARRVGHPHQRLPNTLNLSVPGLPASTLVETLEEVAISSAAACTTAKLQPSHVLGAMGLTEQELRGSFRISLGRFTTAEEIDGATDSIVVAAATLPAP